ncbi:LTA synthase family protein [Acinetobacter faecalis]|uniref:LTA synthase family protein n=1 Tax=Acinetobacter faecalis TaxID=2665161 RepID=UPI002A920685|nr:LTA synthase family protein [Acinetobacter faecalis]MDY6460505.1 LTA synthase family protein [Acinetobacter faecalis]
MKILKQQIIFIFTSIISVITVLTFQNNFDWVFDFKDHRSSLLIHYAFINFIYILFRKKITTIILSQFIIFSLTLINMQKEHYLSTSLLPSDFLLIKESFIVAPVYLKILLALIILITFISIKTISKKEIAGSYKSILLSLTLFLSISIFFVNANFKNNFEKLCLENKKRWICSKTDDLPNTKKNWLGDYFIIKEIGYPTFLVSKILDSVDEYINMPTAISKSQIENLFHTEKSNHKVVRIDETPNIIIIMNEAFWDVSSLKDESIPKNITPTINNNVITNFISPSFGGGTAQVEFEVLSSLNVFINKEKLAYTHQLNKPVYSLPRYMHSLGFNTTAIHNNDKYFYNRHIAYKNLGFDRFISIEDMTVPSIRDNYKNDGGWMTDALLYKQIKNLLNQSDKFPQFIHAITVENHFDYNDDRFGANNFLIKNDKISTKNKRALNTYLSGLKRADYYYNDLIKEAQKIERPTIIIFFGDHLPNLGDIYLKYGFFKDKNEELNKNKEIFFRTPLAIWSNINIDQGKFKKEAIPASFLAIPILESANLPLSPYYQFIKKVNNCFIKIHRTGVNNNAECSEHENILKQYQQLNSDILSGNNFTYEILSNK